MGDARIDAAQIDAIEMRLGAVPNLPWSWGANYEVWKRQEWGARRVAAITEVPNDTEDATGRYSVVDFIVNAPDDIASLVAEVRASASECEKLKAALAALLEAVYRDPAHCKAECDVARALVGSAPQNEADVIPRHGYDYPTTVSGWLQSVGSTVREWRLRRVRVPQHGWVP